MKLNNIELNKIEEKLENYQGEDKMISSHEMQKIIESQPIPEIIKTGIPTLDKVLNGVEAGELIIVSGNTGSGKTTLLITITKYMVNNGIKSSWFTLENSPRNFIKAIAKNGELPLFYLPTKNTENNINWLMERIIEGCIKYNTKVVFIDHLHQIFSIEKMKGNLSLEIADVVAQIKQLAVEYGLVVFLVAHSTDNKMAMNAEPTIRDIRDSGMISRLADSVLGIWRISKGETQEDLRKAKPVLFGETDEVFYNKLRIWKSRREGNYGTAYLEHNNHSFTELDISRMPTGKADKDVGDFVAEIKSDESLGF